MNKVTLIVHLTRLDEQYDLGRHSRKKLQDVGSMRSVQPTKWSVHYHRSLPYSTPIEGSY